MNIARHYENEAQREFEAAVRAGVLSLDRAADNYVGGFMYMGEHVFKNIVTRAYVYAPLKF